MEALIYYLVWAVIFFALMRMSYGAHAAGPARDRGRTPQGAGPSAPALKWIPPETDIDPVCGKTVSPQRAKPSVYDGDVYYFCSRDCREIFEAAPESYVTRKGAPAAGPDEHAHV